MRSGSVTAVGVDGGGGVLIAEGKATCVVAVVAKDPDRSAVRGGTNRRSGGKVNCQVGALAWGPTKPLFCCQRNKGHMGCTHTEASASAGKKLFARAQAHPSRFLSESLCQPGLLRRYCILSQPRAALGRNYKGNPRSFSR